MSCETCSGKGYIHTTGHPSLPDGTEYVERCDECYQEGRVSWTDEQAAEYARRSALNDTMTHYDICRRSAKAHTTEELVEMIDKLDKATLIADDLEMFNALNDEFESRWNTQENYNRLHESAKMGGSFNAAIIDTFFKTDNNNKPRLVRAFPEIFIP
jgi:hypothetical protein